MKVTLVLMNGKLYKNKQKILVWNRFLFDNQKSWNLYRSITNPIWKRWWFSNRFHCHRNSMYLINSFQQEYSITRFVEFKSSYVWPWTWRSLWNQTHCWSYLMNYCCQIYDRFISFCNILGRIVPAIGTTTATVSGLVRY